MSQPADPGPFYHGTRAALSVGDLLTSGRRSNLRPDVVMNHVYFTSRLDIAALAAALCPGDGAERVYVVEPTGDWTDDPNVTDRKFPGNPTRSYRSAAPLRVLSEATGWSPLSAEDRAEWHRRLAANTGDIVN